MPEPWWQPCRACQAWSVHRTEGTMPAWVARPASLGRLPAEADAVRVSSQCRASITENAARQVELSACRSFRLPRGRQDAAVSRSLHVPESMYCTCTGYPSAQSCTSLLGAQGARQPSQPRTSQTCLMGRQNKPALHARPGPHLGETPEHGRAACRHVRQHAVLVMWQQQVEVCVRLLAAAPAQADPLSCWS